MSTITVTTSQLQSICLTDTGKAAVGTEAYTTAINTAMANWLINTPERAALFLAQVTYETAEFQRFVETGSDTYRRRGALPIHGDSEFKGLGKTVVQDLLTHPAYVSLPGFAFEAAGWLWERAGC